MQKLSTVQLGRKSIEEVKLARKLPVVAVLENIRSAYNVGSVFRTADAFLLQSIYIVGYTAKPPHKEIKKTALGAEDSVDWQYHSTTGAAIDELRKNGFQIYAVEQVTQSVQLHELSCGANEKIAVIFGNEVTGVEQSTIELCDGSIEIPQMGAKHSLNIATAAGIVLWELCKPNIALR